MSNPTDEEVYKLAEQIYEEEQRNEFMPPWKEAPSIYARGCLNDAAERLGWSPWTLYLEGITTKQIKKLLLSGTIKDPKLLKALKKEYNSRANRLPVGFFVRE